MLFFKRKSNSATSLSENLRRQFLLLRSWCWGSLTGLDWNPRCQVPSTLALGKCFISERPKLPSLQGCFRPLHRVWAGEDHGPSCSISCQPAWSQQTWAPWGQTVWSTAAHLGDRIPTGVWKFFHQHSVNKSVSQTVDWSPLWVAWEGACEVGVSPHIVGTLLRPATLEQESLAKVLHLSVPQFPHP